MSSDNLVLNNKEIVSRALDVVTDRMQNIIIAEMICLHGQDWWRKEIVSKKGSLGIVRDLPDQEYVDTDEMKGCMDTQLCCKLIRNDRKIFYPSGYDGDFHILLGHVQDIRNERSHTGKMTYSEADTRQALEDLMEFDSAMDLDAHDDLKEYYESIRADPVPTCDISNTPLSDGDAEVDVIKKCSKNPGKTFIDYQSVTVGSCKGYYNALGELQGENKKTSRTIADTSYNVRGEVYNLTLKDSLIVDDTTGVIVDGMEFGSNHVSFEGFDRSTRKVKMYPGPEVKAVLKQDSKIQLYSDMKWLINRTREYFEQYSSMISYPKVPVVMKANRILSDTYKNITDAQIKAVEMILDDPLTYVWGVPGSGKTRYVLATAINECVHLGQRVAVIAPTNYALEQVLGGLLDAFKVDTKGDIDPERDLVRIGTPTSEFIRAHPSICERKGVQAELRAKMSQSNVLKIALADRRYDSLKNKVKDVKGLYNIAGKTSAGAGKLMKAMKPFLDVMVQDPRYSSIPKTVNERNILENADRIFDVLYNKDRHGVDDEDIRNMSEATLVCKVDEIGKDIRKLMSEDSKANIDSCKIVAMTLSKFLMSFGPYASDGRSRLDVDHIFVDEAGYCNCLQVLSLFALGVPVTLLGDHKQLPPVCEVNGDELVASMGTEDHGYDFLWDMSALYVDGFFSDTMGAMSDLYRGRKEPAFDYTSVARLNTTHRFGKNLATSLGKTIYRADVRSNSDNPLDIKVIDAHIDSFPIEYGKVKRKNVPEARAAVDYVRNNKLGRDDYVILAPYKDQIKCLSSEGPEMKDNILTIHKSQGREWDTVIVSVCDGRACNDEKPPRFTSTVVEGSIGEKVINTAVSRAKKKLVIICDKEYWSSRQNELLGELCKISCE